MEPDAAILAAGHGRRRPCCVFADAQSPVDTRTPARPQSRRLRLAGDRAAGFAAQLPLACEVGNYFTGQHFRFQCFRFSVFDWLISAFPVSALLFAMGFQLGAVHLSRGWTQAITLTDWTAS